MASAADPEARAPLIVYVVNHAAFFVSHRLPLALAARERGYRVALVTGQAGSESMEPAAEQALAANGIEHHRVAFTASGTNPFIELLGLVQLVSRLRALRPSLIHCASPKGNLYGGIAARFARVPAVVIAVTGMGFAFTQDARRSLVRSTLASIFRSLAHFAFRQRRKVVIVQNRDDLALITQSGLAREDEVVLLPGSGVDVARFAEVAGTPKEPIVLFPARMLRDKGAHEFIEAARILRSQGIPWRFVMAGAADYDNPTSMPRADLERATAEKSIEWVGHVAKTLPLYASASIVCLPSYREGMPKSLLEAAAAGCAVVTTDVTGCREAVLPGVTGDLVPAREVEPLAAALKTLIQDEQRRESYGRAGRRLAAERYDIGILSRQIMGIYEDLLKHG